MSIVVSEADRVAAAKWAKSNSRHAQAANILRGSCDKAPLVQAFARHAATARLEGALAMREGAAETMEALDQWAFNVMLECAGREEDKIEILLGGAVLDLRDLNRILEWVRITAIDPDPISGEGGE